MAHLNQLGADMKTYQVWSSETVVYMKEVKANTEEDAKNQVLSELSSKGKSYGTSNFKINTVNEIKES
jgi:ribosomal protein L20A (L18A)